MIRFIYGDELEQHSALAHSMFRDRTSQFSERLRWPVKVNAQGEERDQYDPINPLYVIWQRNDGLHGGSMRFLPTTGRCMVNEHFLHLTDGVRIESPLIWECTRFCLAKGAGPRVAATLMMAGAELLERFGLENHLGVFDGPMERVYRGLGTVPHILGSAGRGRTKTSVGLWSCTPEIKRTLSEKSGVSEALMRRWCDQSFGEALMSKWAAA